jgi:hypothetical protein
MRLYIYGHISDIVNSTSNNLKMNSPVASLAQFANMPAREVPFYAFIACWDGPSLCVLGICIVSAVYLAGDTAEETRQYATQSWSTVDGSICSVTLEYVMELEKALDVDRGRLRFVNQVAEFTDAYFETLRKFGRTSCGGTLRDHIGSHRAQEVPIFDLFYQADR